MELYEKIAIAAGALILLTAFLYFFYWLAFTILEKIIFPALLEFEKRIHNRSQNDSIDLF